MLSFAANNQIGSFPIGLQFDSLGFLMISRRLLRILSTVAVVAGCGIAFYQLRTVNTGYGAFLADDSLISYRYAERLSTGHGLTWNDGDRVEGYSNLAWVLALAAYRWAGGDLIRGGRVLGFACSLLTLLVIAYAFRPRSMRQTVATLAGFALASTSTFAVWTTGGLEQPLLALGLAVALALAVEDLDASNVVPLRRHALGAALALMAWTRPDGVLLAGAVLLPWALLRRAARDRVRAALVVGLWPTTAVLGQFLFRVLYYHDFVPSPARAKVAFTTARLSSGFGYVQNAMNALMPLLVFGIVAVVLVASAAPRSRRLALIVGPFVTWLAYLVLVGGDIFPAHRHFVPLVLLSAFAFAEILRLLSAFSIRGVVVALAIAVAVPVMLIQLARNDPQARRAVDERWEWDGKLIGQFLRKAFGPAAPLLAVDPAGCLPYFSGLPSIDMLGLNDRFLAHHPPENLGKGWLGHELGNGDYVLGRTPDLVLFCSPKGNPQPCFRSGKQMVSDPRWAAEYRPVVFEARAEKVVRSFFFVHTVGIKLGARFEGGRIRIPPYLFTGTKGVAFLENDRLVADLPDGHSVEIPITLPRTGRYKIAVEASGPVEISAGLPIGNSGLSDIFEAMSTRVQLALTARKRVLLRGIELSPAD